MLLLIVVAAGCAPNTGAHSSDSPSNSSAPANDSVEEHAVLIHVGTPEDPDQFGLDLIEAPIIEALEGSGAGELDGNEVGPDGAVIYLYGADADVLHTVVKPALEEAPIPPGSYLIKRYGGPGAPQERIDLGATGGG